MRVHSEFIAAYRREYGELGIDIESLEFEQLSRLLTEMKRAVCRERGRLTEEEIAQFKPTADSPRS